MHTLLPAPLQALTDRARSIAAEVLEPQAAEVDRDARWPAEGLQALAAGGMMGLTVPTVAGGLGHGLTALAAVARTLAQGCPSTAMCFGMHCVAAAVIAAKATPSQRDRYLAPIARGEHVTSLALSEPGTGSFFFLPETRLARADQAFVLQGTKTFVTNGGHADSYVVSTRASDEAEEGEFNCLVLDADTPGIAWQAPWHGLGMRGNSSRAMELHDVRVPAENLLGREGDAPWYVFEVVAPYFLAAMASVYVGIARACLESARGHLMQRRQAHTEETLSRLPVVQVRLADIWLRVEQAELLVLHAAQLGDLGSPDALSALVGCKIAACDAAVEAANDAMTLSGGIAYRENGTLSRLLRDARAGQVMAPTGDLLRQWLGRAQLGLPLL